MRTATVQAERRVNCAWPYQPLVPAAVALAAGVTLDRRLAIGAESWLVTVGGFAFIWCLIAFQWPARAAHDAVPRPRWLATIALLLAVTAVGGAWHHVYWNVYPANDVGQWVNRATTPARLRGVVVDEPLVVPPGPRDPLQSRPQEVRTLSALAVHEVWSGSAWQLASGRVQLVFDTEVTSLRAGDFIEIMGDLGPARPAANAGEFDNRDYLRGRRTRALLHCDQPDAVMRMASDRRLMIGERLQRLSGRAERLLRERLPEEEARVAVALLLGRYELMEEDVTELYLRTGTMHILAISGQHLGILAGFLWLVLRAVPIPRKAGAVILGCLVIGYAILTGARPPVLRAAVLVSVLVGSILFDQRARPANALALAVIVVLALNPTDLFDRGFQLSFLAVAALTWLVAPLRTVWTSVGGNPDPIVQLIMAARPWWQRGVLSASQSIVFALVMSTVIWLANVPLLAARFHLFSPIVVPLTVVLTPVVTIALIAGLGLLVIDPIFPSVGAVLAKVCGWGVSSMTDCVRWGSLVPGGYAYVPGPPDWWLIPFYAGLAAVLVFRPAGRARLHALTAFAAWVAIGCAVPLFRPAPGILECQVLSVGNGSAAVLRLPNGRVLLADAGQIAGPRVGSRLIAPALWEQGITRLDGVFISHADTDHFNGLPHLVERFSIGSVFVPPHFAHTDQPPVRLTNATLDQHGVPIRVCFDGDRFEPSPGVVIRVMHPPASFGGADNEQSLVFAVEYLGKRILVTGDLEGSGMRRLLRSESLRTDVLIAPHHGSRKANPPAFVKWADPQLVVVSQGKPRSGATLDVYRNAGIRILNTNQRGAITVRIDASGVSTRTVR